MGFLSRWIWNRERKYQWETAAEYHAEDAFESSDASEFDPLGSYTGVPEDGGAPVQDADDL